MTLTPETLAELRRLLEEYPKAVGFQNVTDAWFRLARAAVDALPALLDSAADQDILIGSVNHYKAERDALRRRLVAVEMLVEDALRHGYDLDPQEIASALASALDATPGGE